MKTKIQIIEYIIENQIQGLILEKILVKYGVDKTIIFILMFLV
jgi:hypothetical protein